MKEARGRAEVQVGGEDPHVARRLGLISSSTSSSVLPWAARPTLAKPNGESSSAARVRSRHFVASQPSGDGCVFAPVR